MTAPTQPSGPTISTEGTINVASVGMITYPVGPEDWFSMRHADWKRVRGRVEKLADPLPYMGQIGWACVGISASAFLALIAWVPAYDQLSTAAHNHFSWVTPLLATTGVFALAFAVFCLIVNMRMRDREKVILSSVLDDMDSCYESYDPEKKKALQQPNPLGAATYVAPNRQPTATYGRMTTFPAREQGLQLKRILNSLSPQIAAVFARNATVIRDQAWQGNEDPSAILVRGSKPTTPATDKLVAIGLITLTDIPPDGDGELKVKANLTDLGIGVSSLLFGLDDVPSWLYDSAND